MFELRRHDPSSPYNFVHDVRVTKDGRARVELRGGAGGRGRIYTLRVTDGTKAHKQININDQEQWEAIVRLALDALAKKHIIEVGGAGDSMDDAPPKLGNLDDTHWTGKGLDCHIDGHREITHIDQDKHGDTTHEYIDFCDIVSGRSGESASSKAGKRSKREAGDHRPVDLRSSSSSDEDDDDDDDDLRLDGKSKSASSSYDPRSKKKGAPHARHHSDGDVSYGKGSGSGGEGGLDDGSMRMMMEQLERQQERFMQLLSESSERSDARVAHLLDENRHLMREMQEMQHAHATAMEHAQKISAEKLEAIAEDRLKIVEEAKEAEQQMLAEHLKAVQVLEERNAETIAAAGDKQLEAQAAAAQAMKELQEAQAHALLQLQKQADAKLEHHIHAANEERIAELKEAHAKLEEHKAQQAEELARVQEEMHRHTEALIEQTVEAFKVAQLEQQAKVEASLEKLAQALESAHASGGDDVKLLVEQNAQMMHEMQEMAKEHRAEMQAIQKHTSEDLLRMQAEQLKMQETHAAQVLEAHNANGEARELMLQAHHEALEAQQQLNADALRLAQLEGKDQLLAAQEKAKEDIAHLMRAHTAEMKELDAKYAHMVEHIEEARVADHKEFEKILLELSQRHDERLVQLQKELSEQVDRLVTENVRAVLETQAKCHHEVQQKLLHIIQLLEKGGIHAAAAMHEGAELKATILALRQQIEEMGESHDAEKRELADKARLALEEVEELQAQIARLEHEKEDALAEIKRLKSEHVKQLELLKAQYEEQKAELHVELEKEKSAAHVAREDVQRAQDEAKRIRLKSAEEREQLMALLPPGDDASASLEDRVKALVNLNSSLDEELRHLKEAQKRNGDEVRIRASELEILRQRIKQMEKEKAESEATTAELADQKRALEEAAAKQTEVNSEQAAELERLNKLLANNELKLQELEKALLEAQHLNEEQAQRLHHTEEMHEQMEAHIAALDRQLRKALAGQQDALSRLEGIGGATPQSRLTKCTLICWFARYDIRSSYRRYETEIQRLRSKRIRGGDVRILELEKQQSTLRTWARTVGIDPKNSPKSWEMDMNAGTIEDFATTMKAEAQAVSAKKIAHQFHDWVSKRCIDPETHEPKYSKPADIDVVDYLMHVHGKGGSASSSY